MEGGGVALHISPVRAMKIKKDEDEIESEQSIKEKEIHLLKNKIKNGKENIILIQKDIEKWQKQIEVLEEESKSPEEKLVDVFDDS